MEEKAKIDTVTSAKQADKLRQRKILPTSKPKTPKYRQVYLPMALLSAAEKPRIKSAEADNAERFGPGSWGQLGSTVERLGRRIWDGLKNAPAPSGGHSARLRSENPGPKSLRDLRPEWFNK